MGVLGLGLVRRSYIRTVCTQAATSKQQQAAAAGSAGLGWAGLDEFEGGPSIRFVMAERTVCARLRVGGWVDGWVSERVSGQAIGQSDRDWQDSFTV